MQELKISVVVPSYNQGQFIEETLNSVLDQEYPNLELIVIDGGSSDQTVEIIKKYQKWIAHWISEPDNGQSHAINKGISACTGDIFNWLNSDDYYESNALNTVAKAFIDSNAKMICGYNRRFWDQSKEVESLVRTKLCNEVEKTIFFGSFRQSPTFFRLNDIKQLKGVNESLHYVMDNELFIRFLVKFGQEDTHMVDDILVNYRLHNSSKTVSQSEKFAIELNQVYERVVKSLPENDLIYLGQRINLRNINSYFYAFKAVKTKRSDLIAFLRWLFKSISSHDKIDTSYLEFLVDEVVFYQRKVERSGY